MVGPVVLEVDRARVLAYRIAAHQLDRSVRRLDDLAVLDLGVQDTPYGSAVQALAARTDEPLRAGDLALVWATRGAPHLHRWADLPALMTALWPLSDSDADARIAGPRVKEAAGLGAGAFRSAAQAFREVVTTAMPKGEVSTGVSARVPAAVTYDCVPCGARHISGSLFQQSGLAGGVRLEARGSTTTVLPLDDPPDIPAQAAGTESLVIAYLRLHGPATPGDAAKFLGIKPGEIRRVWPEGQVEEVRIDGKRAWLLSESGGALRSAPAPRLVRLLPPSDPFLQARDRDLLLPDKARQKEIWRILGNPGVLLVDGEITGTWRARKRGKTALELTITPFERPSADARAVAEEEAERIAAARGATELVVRFDG